MHRYATVPNSNVFQSNGNKRKILLVGDEGSGKSAIKKVVFQQMEPIETRQSEPTSSIETMEVECSTFMKFDVVDFPGKFDEQTKAYIENLSDDDYIAVVYVINIQVSFSYFFPLTFYLISNYSFFFFQQTNFNESIENISQFLKTIKMIPNLSFHFFAHKTDGLSEDHKEGFFIYLKYLFSLPYCLFTKTFLLYIYSF